MKCLLTDTFNWFKEAKPEPKTNDFRVQVGVHFEEVAEMLASLESSDEGTMHKLRNAYAVMHDLAETLKKNSVSLHPTDFVELLDSLCDQIVTATGVAYMVNLDILGGMGEVNGSNYSKFVNGKAILDANGKIQKGPDYYKANLDPFI